MHTVSSDNNENTTPRQFDLICKNCGKTLENNMVDVAEANRRHKEHADQEDCEAYNYRFVPTGIAPVSKFYNVLKDAVRESSEETIQEVRQQLKPDGEVSG